MTSGDISIRNLAANANDPSTVPLIITLSDMTIQGFGPGAISLVGNIQASFVNVTFRDNGKSTGPKVYGGAIHVNSAYDGSSTSTSGIYYLPNKGL